MSELGIAQLIRTYKSNDNISFDVLGYFKLLLFGRILYPSSNINSVLMNDNYYEPVLSGNYNECNIYDTLDFIGKHKNAIFSRINTNMVKKFGRTKSNIYYDVTNSFFEKDNIY